MYLGLAVQYHLKLEKGYGQICWVVVHGQWWVSLGVSSSPFMVAHYTIL